MHWNTFHHTNSRQWKNLSLQPVLQGWKLCLWWSSFSKFRRYFYQRESWRNHGQDWKRNQCEELYKLLSTPFDQSVPLENLWQAHEWHGRGEEDRVARSIIISIIIFSGLVAGPVCLFVSLINFGMFGRRKKKVHVIHVPVWEAKAHIIILYSARDNNMMLTK